MRKVPPGVRAPISFYIETHTDGHGEEWHRIISLLSPTETMQSSAIQHVQTKDGITYEVNTLSGSTYFLHVEDALTPNDSDLLLKLNDG